MRVSAPVTDYIRASTMNTKGDLVVRGDLVPERLTAGLVDTYLKAQGAGELPIYEKLALRDTGVHIGHNTRNMEGIQLITGVGFQSSVVIFIAHAKSGTDHAGSYGFDDTTNHMCIYFSFGLDNLNHSYDNCMQLTPSLGNSLYAHILAVSNEGFTLSWTLQGTVFTNYIYLCLP
ncbi:hypothetical protein ES708_12296 [subsurface metagenome]